MILRILLAIGILVVVGGLIWQIRAWVSGSMAISRRQKVLRVVSAALMLAIMGMILAGDMWLTPYGPIAKMVYWMMTFVFAVILVVLALFDLKEVGLRYGERRKQIFHDLAKPVDEDKVDG